MSELKREVFFEAGYDKRNSDPKKDYGISAMKIRFVLSGDKGACQFLISTDWYLPNIQKEKSNDFEFNRLSRGINGLKPSGWDIGYHVLTSQYEGQEPIDNKCEYLNGQPCFYDGSGLQAEEFIPEFLAGGSDAVWKMLEERYKQRFEADAILDLLNKEKQ